MKITNLEELKEATAWVRKLNLEKRQKALSAISKAKQYTPNYDTQFKCAYCEEVTNFDGRCSVCGEELYEMDAF